MLSAKPNTQPPVQDFSQRRFARYAADRVPLVVTSQTQAFHAVAVDESIGGLGIETDESVALEVGEVVCINYRDSRSDAQITAVVPNATGGCRISISWDERQQLPATSARRAFYKYDGVAIVCECEAPTSDDMAMITLWNGKKFEVELAKLEQRTLPTRSIELQTMGKMRQIVAQLYGLETHGNDEEVCGRILQFEFS